MNLSPIEVGHRIRSIRKEKGLTMEEFGKLIGGVKKSAVGNWERGDNLPNNERLKRIAELGNLEVNELLYGSIENFRYSIIKQLYEGNMLETGMKENNKELYRYIGGTEFINEVYEQVAKENLGYDDRDKIVRTFKMMYNRRLFSHLTKKSNEKEKLETAENTVNLNLALEYFERKAKIDIALKENHEQNANNKNNLIPFDPANFDRVPKIILDDKPLNDDEIKKVAESIEEIRSNRK